MMQREPRPIVPNSDASRRLQYWLDQRVDTNNYHG